MLKENLLEYIQTNIIDNAKLPAMSNYNGQTLTYSQVGYKIISLHNLFKKNGIKKGDRIAILGKNSVNWAVTYLAIVTYGAVVVPILPDFNPADVHHIINHSDSILLFSLKSLYEDLDEEIMKNLLAIISLEDFKLLFKRKKSFQNILEKENKESKKFQKEIITKEELDFQVINNDELEAIVYTSGTTGFSKGVMLSHNNIIANIIFAKYNMELLPGDKILSFLPIAHSFGCAFEFLFPICSGCHIIFLTKIPSPKIILNAFKNVKPRLILSVPLIIEKIYNKKILPVINKQPLKTLMKLPITNKMIKNKIKNSLKESFGNNFKEIIIGGAALNDEVEQFFKDIKFPFTIGYGMTECGPLISYSSWEKHKKNSVGKIVDTLEVKIDSDDPYNIVGEILVKGENVMQGYYKNDKETKKAIDKDNWLHTGDLGLVDSEDNIFIKGRSKSLILGPSGQNIYPEEIETKLNNLPFVVESIVVKREGKLIALVHPNLEEMDKKKVEQHQLETIMEKNRETLNNIIHSYCAISKIELVADEFEKTPKKSIKRYKYL